MMEQQVVTYEQTLAVALERYHADMANNSDGFLEAIRRFYIAMETPLLPPTQAPTQ